MNPPTNSPVSKSLPGWLLIAVAILITAFLWLFYRQPLHEQTLRYDLWLMILDDLLEFGGDSNFESEAAPASGLQFLPQRFPLFAWSAFLLSLAACHGAAISTCVLKQIKLHRNEQIVVCLGTGLATLSLVILGCGLMGKLSLFAISTPSAVSAILAAIAGWRNRSSRQTFADTRTQTSPRASRVIVSLVLLIGIPFAVYLLIGATSPSTDFDVREYHLQGPKEWFQQGQISFLRHNVYTSFPFLSEMLSLAGMVVTGDWWHGALVGQIVLAYFQLLSTLAVFSIARRWIHPDVAWLAALIYLTTPWTLRVSLIAYAEGSLTFYLIASTMVGLLAFQLHEQAFRISLLCGLLAGSAMASKYTGLISVIIPTAVLLTAAALRKDDKRQKNILPIALAFCAGVGCMIGPWLLRNFYDTGNPVYPLGFSVFGGSEWSSELNDRWKPAHGPSEHRPDLLLKHFLDAAVYNSWTSGLLFAMSIPSILLCRKNKTVAIVLSLTVWGFFTWWALTHRIDRFWVPLIPLLSIAAASLWMLSESRSWRGFLLIVVVAATAANIRFCGTALIGFHAGLMDLESGRQYSIRSDIRFLNRTIPDTAKVLMVGDAEVFDCTFPLLYNTVFDDCLFEEWTTNPADSALPVRQRRMLSAKEILNTLHAKGVTHICVHWGEILRYRLPGSYGYTEYLQPARFETLVTENILLPPRTLLARPGDSLSAAEEKTVEAWDGFSSLLSDDGSFSVVQLYKLADSPQQ